MAGFEKVIKGLECCIESAENVCSYNCPYIKVGSCVLTLHKDALELLKEQETELCDRCGRRRVKTSRVARGEANG